MKCNIDWSNNGRRGVLMMRWLLCAALFAVNMATGQVIDDKDRLSTSDLFVKSSPMQQSPTTQLKPVIMDGPVDPKEYTVGPGDIFSVNIWATPPTTFQVPVTPEGTVIIPSVGEVAVAGFSLDSARRLAMQAIKKKYIISTASFTLSNPRSFTVTVTGAVLNPGTVVVQATQRIDAAVRKSNDVQTYFEQMGVAQPTMDQISAYEKVLKTSGRRRVSVTRKSGDIVFADFERYTATLDPRFNPLLRDGDVVIVPPVDMENNIIEIVGAVSRPGRFEFVPGDSLQASIRMAGGLTPVADSTSILISRNDSDGHRKEIKIDNTAGLGGDFALAAGDRIIVKRRSFHDVGGIVMVEGEVQNPGPYAIIKDSTTLSEIIDQAGGFTQFASLNGASVSREVKGSPDSKMISLLRYNRGKSNSEDTAYFRTMMQLTNTVEITSIDFVALFERNDSTKNIILHDGDRIVIPARNFTVYVFGEVRHPGHVSYTPHKELSYYLSLAGGLTENAESGDIRVIKAGSKQWLEPGETSIEEGDYIWIPKVPYRSYGYYLDVYSKVFGIVGTVATLYILIRQLH